MELEKELPGIRVLSSGMGSVRADTGWCRHHDIFCVSGHGCPDFDQRENLKTGENEPGDDIEQFLGEDFF